MNKGGGSVAALVVVGLLLGALCFAAGFLVIGMGHGWGWPMQAGPLALLAYPVALFRWRAIERTTPWRRELALTGAFVVIALALAVALDLLPPPPPIPFADLLLLAVPVALLAGIYLLAQRGLHAAWGDAILLGSGVLLDIAAFADHATATWRNTGGVLLLPWLILWLGWQAVAAGALVRHLRAQPVTA